MLAADCIRELQSSWFPNMTDAGLRRLVELLEQNSPLLIHGSFTQAVPMGCLATQAGWNHPRAARYTRQNLAFAGGVLVRRGRVQPHQRAAADGALHAGVCTCVCAWRVRVGRRILGVLRVWLSLWRV